MGTLKALPFLAVFLFACGSSDPSESAPAVSEQALTLTTPASTATHSELGVLEWHVVHHPDGEMAVVGVDDASAPRVVLAMNEVEVLLRMPTGRFGIAREGNEVRANTIAGNGGALRAIELIRQDLGSDSGATSSLETSALRGGELLPTTEYERCAKGTLVANCPQLLVGDCNADKLHTCGLDSGQRAAGAQALVADCPSNVSEVPKCEKAWDDMSYAEKNLRMHGCYQCGAQWRQNMDAHSLDESLKNCKWLSVTANANGTPSNTPICDFKIEE